MNEKIGDKDALAALHALVQARVISKDDPEAGHVLADRILEDFVRSLGYDVLADEFSAVQKWYS